MFTRALFGFLFSVAVAAHADPLAEADAFLESPAFADSFRCGDEANYHWMVKGCRFGCGPDGCGSVCEKQNLTVNRFVGKCEAEAAQVYSDDGMIIDIAKSSFETDKGNTAKAFLAQINEFLQVNGSYVLLRTTPAEYKTIVDGVEQTLTALHIEGDYTIAPGTPPFDFILTLVKGTPGVAQIARFRMGSTTWFRLKDVKRAP